MNFVKNLFSVKYYTDILAGYANFKPIVAAVVLALILSIKPSWFIFKTTLPLARNLEENIMDLIEEIYPQELEIKITNGQVSTNVTEPYYVTVPQETLESLLSLKHEDQNTKSKIRLLAIDTKGKADEFERYQSLALLTETSVVYYRDNNVNIYPLREVKDLTVNKDAIKSKVKDVNKDNKVEKITVIGVLLAPFFVLSWLVSTRLIVFLLLTLIVYLMIKINQLPIGFKNAFRYTSAISFIPTFIWSLMSFIPFFAGNIFATSYLLPIVIWGLAYSGLNYFKNHQMNS
jgi:hypothetical protein